MAYSTIEIGKRGYSKDYYMFFTRGAEIISPLHDIPLLERPKEKIFNMVVEIPKLTTAQMEITLGETLNPIRHVTENGQLKYTTNRMPYHGYPWNYGALPQTWESPSFQFGGVRLKGDNRPMDVIEIGQRVVPQGEVLQVKVLGAIAMVANGAVDFKVIAIDVKDPLAKQMHEIPDVRRHCESLLSSIYDWLRYLDVLMGDKPNKFAFFEEFACTAYTYSIINEAHRCWQQLILSDSPINISRSNRTLMGSVHLMHDPVSLYFLFKKMGIIDDKDRSKL